MPHYLLRKHSRCRWRQCLPHKARPSNREDWACWCCGQASLDSLKQAWETRPERVWEGIGQLFVGTLLTITGLGLLV